MVALTVSWTKVAVYVLTAVCLLACAALGLVVLLLGSTVAYIALCMGMKVLAAVVFAIAWGPLVALCVIAAAFWNDTRRERLQRAVGGAL